MTRRAHHWTPGLALGVFLSPAGARTPLISRHRFFRRNKVANTSTRNTSDVTITQVAEIDSTYTVDIYDTVILAKTAGSAFTATLPEAASVPRGHEKVFKKIDASANDLTVSRAGTDTIDGANTKVLGAQYDYLRIVSDGVSAWHVVGSVLST
jgi:hypothetical protein